MVTICSVAPRGDLHHLGPTGVRSVFFLSNHLTRKAYAEKVAACFELRSKTSPGRKRRMAQLMNGTVECAECRNEIRYADEFNCSYCGASLCDNCLFHHEDECDVSITPRSLS